MKSSLKYLFQIIMTIFFIYSCVRIASLPELKEALSHASPNYILYVLLIMPIAVIIRAWRWWYLICKLLHPIPFKPILESTFIGHTFNIFLPASLGDVVRSFYSWKELGNKEVMLATSILDKVIALFSLSIIGLISSVIIGTTKITTITALLSIFLATILVFPRLIPWRLASILFMKIFKKDLCTRTLIKSFMVDYKTLIISVLISLFGWLATNMMYYFSWKAFSYYVPLWYSFAVAPLINILRLIPITISGIGSVDLLIVFLFKSVGMKPSDSLMGSIVINIILILLPGLLGAFILIKKRREQ